MIWLVEPSVVAAAAGDRGGAVLTTDSQDIRALAEHTSNPVSVIEA
jgi:hypothetical protein